MLIELGEGGQAGEARRAVQIFAEDLKLDETRCGQIALATTELATNVVKHAGRGHVLVQRVQRNGDVGVRLTGVDKGPGIADVNWALSDGNSTAGSMGTGLGAIRRISDAFEIYSKPGSGTVVVAEFWERKKPGNTHQEALEVAVVSEPIRGEEVCGDGWGVRDVAGDILLMVVDGLGHGVLAAEAARQAEQILAESKESSPLRIINDTHLALRATRGAAEAIAKIDTQRGLLNFVGVGNICASIVTPDSSRGLASHNGTLGGTVERLQEFTVPWNKNSILIMHSDGLTKRWDLQQYAGIWNQRASIIAALLHRDFNRNRDDVTVLVAKAA